MTDESRYGLKMLDIDDTEVGILAYSIDGGEISEDAASAIWQRFDDAKASGKKIRLYAEMLALPKVNSRLVMDKLKHLGVIFTTLDRMVIIGDSGWMDVYAKIINPITKFNVKHFTLEQKEESIVWIKE